MGQPERLVLVDCPVDRVALALRVRLAESVATPLMEPTEPQALLPRMARPVVPERMATTATRVRMERTVVLEPMVQWVPQVELAQTVVMVQTVPMAALAVRAFRSELDRTSQTIQP